MIELRNLTKTFNVKGTRKYVAKNLNITFPANRSIGLLGRNGAGKSTLLKVIAGTMLADSGEVFSQGDISWQIGFAGSFHPELSGRQNVLFVGRAYGIDTRELIDFVEDFSELGPSFHAPFRTYSSGMRARLAFGVSMGIPFSYYLIDEVTAVGDAAFRKKCSEVLKQRLQNAGALIVSHSEGVLRDLCTSGAVLEKGEMTWHEDINKAIEEHNKRMVAS